MPLHLFFDNLRKAHQIEVVVIVDDNAQLTLENRIRAAKSFPTFSGHETGRRLCRWSSNPALIRRSSESSIASHKKASPLKTTSEMHNARWATFKLRTSLPPMYSSLPKISAHHSAPASPATSSQRPSLKESNLFTSPKLPERPLSPARLHAGGDTKSLSRSILMKTTSKVKKDEDKKDSGTTSKKSGNSLRDALGAMAPTTTPQIKKSSSKRSTSKRSTKNKDPQQEQQRETAVTTDGIRELPSLLLD